ncbi:hypothetical protein QQG55_15065 [Brugia pahangi]
MMLRPLFTIYGEVQKNEKQENWSWENSPPELRLSFSGLLPNVVLCITLVDRGNREQALFIWKHAAACCLESGVRVLA